MRGRRLGAVMLALAAVATWFAPHARAHELPGTSATLVVRDGGFVQLKLQLPWSDVLHRVWMPDAQMAAFLGAVVNQSPTAFAASLAKVQAALAREVRVSGNDGAPMVLTRWVWPSAIEVQTALRTELMARLATPTADHHGERFTANAEVRLGTELTTVQLQTSASLGPTLLIVYRPIEQWLGVGARSAPAPVRRP